jgi:hypothetical protein
MIEPERPEDYSKAAALSDWRTWESVFESYWTGMNNNYLFWDMDPTDWDGVYRNYQPKFAALDMADENSFETAYSYFQDITKDLVDGHYLLEITDPNDGNIIKTLNPIAARYFKEYSGGELDYYTYAELNDADKIAYINQSRQMRESEFWYERFNRPDGHTIKEVVKGHFENSGGEYAEAQIGDWKGKGIAYSNFKVATGSYPALGGHILYFRFTGFSYQTMIVDFNYHKEAGLYDAVAAYEEENGKTDDDLLLPDSGIADVWRFALELKNVLQLTDAFFDGLKDPALKGAIIDLRDNPGGYNSDLSWLWGRMTSRELTFAWHRSKLGDNRLDYSPWMPLKIFPDPVNGVDLQVPVVALVNKRTVSCGEFSAMIIASMPGGHVVGGTTWGGQGTLTDNREFNGGQFTAPLLKLVYTPSVQIKYLDGICYEGKGFPPDIFVPFDYNALQAGRDTRLEAAIQCVLDNQ